MDFVWLMGSDNLDIFRRWHRWAEFVRAVPVVVVLRPGTVMAALRARFVGPLGSVLILDGKRNAQSAHRDPRGPSRGGKLC